MLSRNTWARVAALTASLVIVSAAWPADPAVAQEAPSQALEQARSGEDGSSGAGADSGNTSTGNAKRDKDGNGGNSSAGSAGEGGTTESADSGGAPLPENAEVLDALGVLDDVTIYDLDILTGLDIPVELLPPPPAEPVSTVPDDINTGGQGSSGGTSTGELSTDETSTISTEPGSGAAPAGGSTNTAAADGVGSTDSGEKNRDRPRKNADGSTDTATSG